ncbi:MAG: hypothetical protein M3Y06_03430 [Actinomycetota bacterium]|nr:hypothetical protein [Actinomycetota bacterium]
MSEPQTVVERLLGSRDALVLDVRRLAAAIDELDSVIVGIAGETRRPAPWQIVADDTRAETTSNATAPNRPEDVNSPAEGELAHAAPLPTGNRPTAKKAAREAMRAPARTETKATPTKAPPRKATRPQKSIRVHVLEMLSAEDREFGLAEIIDRIHAEGIQAHDDAVRSITIKLMKDGKIERPSRGLYRFARRRRAVTPEAPTPSPTQTLTPTSSVAERAPAALSAPPADYTPPLNLGQPWDRRS